VSALAWPVTATLAACIACAHAGWLLASTMATASGLAAAAKRVREDMLIIDVPPAAGATAGHKSLRGFEALSRK
jgi:hypothetical protein